MTPTHTARRPHVRYVHRGRGFGHTTRRLGQVHAATIEGRHARPICGEPAIPLVEEDYDTGDPVS